MILRRLGAADAGFWCAIREEALRLAPEHFAPPDAGPPPDARADFVARLRDGTVWAALGGREILGLAARGSDAANPRRVWLQSLYTRPGARRQGLARRLIAAVEAEAAEAGAREVWLEVGLTNAPARVLYSACGYALLHEGPATVLLRKKLGQRA